jgi:ABC-type multidrug transport system fused ATPase/permease subunit
MNFPLRSPLCRNKRAGYTSFSFPRKNVVEGSVAYLLAQRGGDSPNEEMMKENRHIANGPLRNLWAHIPPTKRLGLASLLGLMVFAAMLEVVSLGALLPFLIALFNPEKIWGSRAAVDILGLVGIGRGAPIEAILAVGFIAVALVAGAVRLFLLQVSTRYAFSLGSYLAIRIFSGLLGLDYLKVISFESSQIISAISVKINNVIYMVILPVLTAATAAVMIVGIAATIFVIDSGLALLMFGGFGAMYFLVLRYTKKKLFDNGRLVALSDTRIVKIIQESMGGVKDIVLSGTRAKYDEIYRKTDLELRRAQGDNAVIGTAPRFFIETVAMIGIAALAYYMVTRTESKELAFSLLGVIALAAQRLLPLMQQAYLGVATIRGGKESLKEVLSLLDQCQAEEERPLADRLDFANEVRLVNVGFQYPGRDKAVLENVNLTIRKGECIGFVGPSGGGKSTLLDIVMGLLHPTSGHIEVDGVRLTRDNIGGWRRSVAHVPQSIFLIDASVKENIKFGSGREDDSERDMRDALKRAHIDEDVKKLAGDIEARVGERGANLSGGQKQRLGIARALYRRSPLLVFDEATSALDGATERAVMHSLEQMSGEMTVLMIAHRVDTLRNCDRIIELRGGSIERIGTYAAFYGGDGIAATGQ